MPEIRRKYDPDFKAGAVRIVNETRKPIAQVARDLGINEGTLANWVNLARAAAEKDVGRPVGGVRAGRAGAAAPGERRAGDGA